MKKEKNKSLLISLCSVLLLGASALVINLPKEQKQETSSTLHSSEITPGLSHKDVKLRSNGDFVTLVANVNSDASIKGVTFESDRTDCVTVTRVSENSAKLTRIKEFTGLVIITVTSKDVFSNFKETCNVRCYNKLTSFNDTYSGFMSEDSATTSFDDVDVVYLNQSHTTEVCMNISSTFGEADIPYTDGTFTNIEEDDLNSIKAQVETIFAPNKIKNYRQTDNKDCSDNAILFEVDYKTDIIGSNKSKSVTIECDGEKLILNLVKYVPVTSIDINNGSIIVL